MLGVVLLMLLERAAAVVGSGWASDWDCDWTCDWELSSESEGGFVGLQDCQKR